MPVDPRTVTKLDRAYVEGEVIRSGLHRLAKRLKTADTNLAYDLRDCSERFDAYMRELRSACERAEARARTN